MSNYHILAGNKDGNSFQIAMHIPVPNVANEVGMNYRVVLVEWRPDVASQVPFIEVTEQTQLDAGELYEHLITFYTYPGEDLIAKRNRLDILYTEVVSQVQGALQKMLGYWGYSRDVT